MAENSTRLINCPPAETGTRLKQVLGELSRTIDADRAYVVFDEKPLRVHTWSKDGVTFPKGWPWQALAAAEQLGMAEPNVTVPDTAALPPGPIKDALTQVIFGVVGVVMKFAPIGAFGAMAFTVGKFGLASLGPLVKLITVFWATSILFVVMVLGVICRLAGFSDKKQTEELGRKIVKLVACRANREAPDKSLAEWLEGLPDRIREALGRYDLLSTHTVAASKPLAWNAGMWARL